MTESDWLAATDTHDLLRHLGASRRKLRLFTCSCCSRIWHLLLHKEESQRAVQMSERYADGLVAREEMREVDDWAFQEAVDCEGRRATGTAAGAVRAATWVGLAGVIEGAGEVEWHAAWEAVNAATGAVCEELHGSRNGFQERERLYCAVRVNCTRERSLVRNPG